MLFFVLAYLGGVLTILSPCILPVLPFVFARSDRPFLKSGLPLLAGMAATFALVASLAAVGGGWAVRANQFGRIAALILFALFGLMLLSSSLAERLTRPLVQLGSKLSSSSDSSSGILSSFLLGIATGLLWTPCAGPILGLILTGAALSGASAHTALLLLVYAAGAATSLAVVLLAGGRVFAALKRSLGADVWIRRILGVAVLAGVAAVAFGLDRGVLTRLSLAGTSGLEQRLLALAAPAAPQNQPQQSDNNPGMMMMFSGTNSDGVPITLPDLSGANAWLNSSPLTPDSLRGKVVVVDFWTYSCINCLRALPYVEDWAAKYKDAGLVVIGVHTPEFAFEKERSNVEKAVRDLKISYPVATDSDYRIWQAFSNEYWPAHYFIDGTGRIRYHHFGEGEYSESERVIKELLRDNGAHISSSGTTSRATSVPVNVAGTGAEAAPDSSNVRSPETYVGYHRAEHFASTEPIAQDSKRAYTPQPRLSLN